MSLSLTNEQIEALLFSGDDADTLAKYFGADDYFELRELAEQIKLRDEDGPPLGVEAARKRVYIVPGIMGSRLWARRFGPDDWIWLDPVGIALGDIRKLKFGEEPRPVYASGALLPAYAKMKFRLLLAGFDAEYLPYDWRQSIPDLGKTLLERIRADGESSVGLVCHSMGGLVARRMAELDHDGSIIDRIITLGTPNSGSYSPVELCALTHTTLLQIGKLDQVHTPKQIAEDYVRHFPGLIEMLPSPQKRPQEPFFTVGGWASSGVRPLKAVLTKAEKAQSALAVPDDRFVQIIGMNQQTIQRATIDGGQFRFERNLDGDGTVPRDLAELGSVGRYYVDGGHGGLLNLKDCITAVTDILETGKTSVLRTSPTLGGLAVEHLDSTENISAQALREEQAPSPDAEITEDDILGSLISGGQLPSADVRSRVSVHDAAAVPPVDQPSALIDAVPDPGGADSEPEGWLNGYPVSSLKTAAQVWQNNTERRVAGDRHAEKGEALKAEPKVRQNLYARRMLVEAQRFVDVQNVLDADEQNFLQMPSLVSETLLKIRSERTNVDDFLVNEKVMGEFEEFMSVLFLKRAPIAAKSVCRVVRRKGNFGFGTGFLVAPGVLLTNHHVLSTKDDARRAYVQFDYEITLRRRQMISRGFDLLPDRFFIADDVLDFAFVAVAERDQDDAVSLSDYGYLPLIKTLGKIRAEKPVNIVQHPKGGRKQVVFRKSKLTPLPETVPGEQASTSTPRDFVLQYTGDTESGSSGSPVFNDLWEVVGLHHAAVPIVNDNGEFKLKDGTFLSERAIKAQRRAEDVVWVANEGIRTSKIIARLTALESTEQDPDHVLFLKRILAVGEDAEVNGSYDHITGRQPPAFQVDLPGPSNEAHVPRIPEAPHTQIAPSATLFGTDWQPAAAVRTSGGTISMTIPVTISVTIGTDRGVATPSGQGDGGPAGTASSFLDERRYSLEDLADRQGFDRDFLCERVELPTILNTSSYTAAERLDCQGKELTYDHYSVVMSKERRLAYFSAGNFDPSAPFHPARGEDPWSIDPRIEEVYQADNHFYRHNDLDRGHLFRRTDGSWGATEDEALRADHDTYFWTNIAPQHEIYNQSSKKKEWLLWGQLENHVTEQAGNDRVSIFNGPVFSEGDPSHRGLQIPKAFWKVVITCDERKLRAHAFMIGQETLLTGLSRERFEPGPFDVYQLKLRTLETLIHLDFGVLRGADVMEGFSATERFDLSRPVIPLRKLTDVLI